MAPIAAFGGGRAPRRYWDGFVIISQSRQTTGSLFSQLGIRKTCVFLESLLFLLIQVFMS
jgi:DNA-directed RNA polymerase subunit N (RpoN/RPB10)